MPTKIEWAQEVWNPITGCTPISEGCANCYAKRMANRLRGRYGYPADDPFRVTFHPDRLDQPLKWKKPRMIFVCSMGDLFHEAVSDRQINEVWMKIYNRPEHKFLLLTKRPQRMKLWTEAAAAAKTWPVNELWPENAWLGVTAENQQRADERIPILLRIPAAVRFVSYEPALGPVDFANVNPRGNVPGINALNGGWSVPRNDGWPMKGHRGLDWIIAGGESGHGARPAHPDWFRSVRDQCKAAGVPFFFKQHGEYIHESQLHDAPDLAQRLDAAGVLPDLNGFYSVGKKAAGRMLDGEEHNGWPKGWPRKRR